MFRRALPWLALVVLSIAFRWPVLANAHELNSDVAIVGLQARHFLHGEFAWFLWGSGYQSATDSAWAAVLFSIFGASPTVLLASALSLHCALTLLVYSALRRKFPDALWTAFTLTCLLVFTTAAVHSYALYPPRQAALTLAIAGLVAADYAEAAKRPALAYFFAAALAGLACFADPYARLLVPVTVLVVGLNLRDVQGKIAAPLFALAAGAACGFLPDFLLRHSATATHQQVALSMEGVARNWQLLRETCGPWALGHGTFVPQAAGGYGFAETSPAVHYAQVVASCMFLGACASALPLAFVARIPTGLRRLGAASALGAFGTFAAFLLSPMVSNHFHMRYLAAATLLAPFAMAPLAQLLQGFAPALLSPILMSVGFSGYASFGADLRLTRPNATAFDTPRLASAITAEDDAELIKLLRAAEIQFAMADYWSAYRLSFLAGEQPQVVPKNAGEDRYGPARAGFTAAVDVAYIYDPRRSFEGAEGAKREAQALGRVVATRTAGLYTVYLVRRTH